VLVGGEPLLPLRRLYSWPTPPSLGRRTPSGWLGASFTESSFRFLGGCFAIALSCLMFRYSAASRVPPVANAGSR
jgi:hypothetical protein